MKHKKNISNLLRQIEKDAVNEFDQLADIGAAYFSTADLLRLRGKWEESFKTFAQLHRLLLWVGACSPVWVLAAFPFGMLGYIRFAYFLMGLFPLTFIAFAIGSYLLKRKYNSKGYLEYIGSLIDEELKKRVFENRPFRRRR